MIFSKPFYYILNLKDHHLNKKKILSMISHKGECVDDGYSVISKTDWNNQERENFNWYSFSLSESLASLPTFVSLYSSIVSPLTQCSFLQDGSPQFQPQIP